MQRRAVKNEDIEMPLVKGKTKEAIKANIKKEVKAGKPLKQSIAIALTEAREAGAKIPKKKAKKMVKKKGY